MNVPLEQLICYQLSCKPIIKYQVCLQEPNWYIILIFVLEILNCRIKGLKMLRFPSFLQVNFQMFEKDLTNIMSELKRIITRPEPYESDITPR